MSHTTKIKGTKVTSVSALRAAVARLQREGVECSLAENVRPRMYYEQQHEACPLVVQLPNGKYDVGFTREADGSYVPVFDEYANHVSAQIGAACPLPTTAEGRQQHQIGRLMQAYSVEAAREAAVRQGYIIQGESTDDHGNVHLVVQGMG